jgi:hypothetical protein
MEEMGKLRDERRQLQLYVPVVLCGAISLMYIAYSEIAELKSVKAKHSHGGAYAPDWRPEVSNRAFIVYHYDICMFSSPRKRHF